MSVLSAAEVDAQPSSDPAASAPLPLTGPPTTRWSLSPFPAADADSGLAAWVASTSAHGMTV